jgi:hypothetical protein
VGEEVWVEYRVPVFVKVDLDEERVVRVVVDDENIGKPVGVETDKGEPIDDDDMIKKAYDVVDTSEWTPWENGF